MKQDYECIVLGLGGIGSGAAYWLSKQLGDSVLGIEQFELGHSRGGSQDHSRIIRHSYHSPDYVRLTQRTFATWAAVSAEAGEELVLKTGGLDLEPANSAIPLEDYYQSLADCNIPFEILDPDEVMRRWPQFRLTDDIRTIYQADAGLVKAARANAAHQRLAREHGATLLDKTPISHIRAVDNEVEVTAGDMTYRCGKLIISAGAWTNHALAHFGLNLPLTVTQEQVSYFATPHLADFVPDRFPIWIWLDEPCYYGFPVYGEQGTKVAQDVGGREVTADSRTFEPDPAAAKRVTDFMAKYLPTALGPLIYTKTCLYTMPPDRDFIIDSLPEHDNIFLAVGAGHAFKFASLIGRILAELALDSPSESDLSRFRFNRPILQEPHPTRQFMV
jgi:sarcosine oxidase